MASPKWLFFDMGSTLIDETQSYKAWFCNASQAIGGALGAQEIENEYCAGMARGNPTISGQLKRYGYASDTTADLYPSQLDVAYPEASAVLQELSKRYKLGIIANQKVGAQARMEAYGLRAFFDCFIASAEAGVAKPDPQIFLLALSSAGCKAENAVMIGDRIDNDIRPAKALGFTTVRILQGYGRLQSPQDKHSLPDYTINSLPELLEIF